jgi:hypothetical protein
MVSAPDAHATHIGHASEDLFVTSGKTRICSGFLCLIGRHLHARSLSFLFISTSLTLKLISNFRAQSLMSTVHIPFITHQKGLQ